MEFQDPLKGSVSKFINVFNNKRFILFMLLFSIVIRFGLAFAMKDTFLDRGNRSGSIIPIAENMINHGEFSITPGNPTAVNEPLYTTFIAFCFILFGKNWLGVFLLA